LIAFKDLLDSTIAPQTEIFTSKSANILANLPQGPRVLGKENFMKNLAIGPVLYICPQISPIEIKHHQPGGRSSNTFEVISKLNAVKEPLVEK